MASRMTFERLSESEGLTATSSFGGSFIYGLIASMFYGWIVAIIFVFFYNLWTTFAGKIMGRKYAGL